jgi:hypothetical protein
MSKAIHRALGIARRGDTGMNLPESEATLKAQQEQLVTNSRAVQMFPKGTRELPLPRGMKRLATPRGIFHYNPDRITREAIIAASAKGHEHSLLGLGSVPKAHVMHRIQHGEHPVAIVERDKHGTEIRAALGTHATSKHQFTEMQRTKDHGNDVSIEHPAKTIEKRRLAKDNS